MGRLFTQFTPVGWQVRDRVTGEEIEAFGTGADEYRRAKDKATAGNRRCGLGHAEDCRCRQCERAVKT